jgi:hypothetical protein
MAVLLGAIKDSDLESHGVDYWKYFTPKYVVKIIRFDDINGDSYVYTISRKNDPFKTELQDFHMPFKTKKSMLTALDKELKKIK